MSQSSSSRNTSISGGSNSARQSKSSYDANFEQNMIDGGIYPHNRASKPKNTGDTRDFMTRHRPSLSPSQFGDEDFEEFTNLCNTAGDEANARADIMSIIAGEARKQHRMKTC